MIIMTPAQLVQNARKNISAIDKYEAEQLINSGATIIDVREPEEFSTGFIPNAINIPRGILEFAIGFHPIAKDPQATYVIYCRTTNRAIMGTESLKKIGYTNVHALDLGFPEWVQAGGSSSH